MTKREQAHRWVLELIEAGLTMQDIQRDAGIHFSTLRALRDGAALESDKISGRIYLGIKALHDRMFGVNDHTLRSMIQEQFEQLQLPASPADLFRLRNPKARKGWDALPNADQEQFTLAFERYLAALERADYNRYDAYREAIREAMRNQ